MNVPLLFKLSQTQSKMKTIKQALLKAIEAIDLNDKFNGDSDARESAEIDAVALCHQALKELEPEPQTKSHTPGPWRIGKTGGAVVADHPVNGGGTGHSDTDYYGGHLIAESIARLEDAKLIAAAPELLAMLERIANSFPELEDDDEEMNGADTVEKLGELYPDIISAIKNAHT
jgi:hypothetical protein